MERANKGTGFPCKQNDSMERMEGGERGWWELKREEEEKGEEEEKMQRFKGRINQCICITIN